MNSNSIKKETKETDSASSKSSEKLSRSIQRKYKRANLRRKRSSKLAAGRGVIYIGHIPHGFYEDEMTSYFNQFGTVTAAAVARSKRTGRSKGYGFVEFSNQEVAKVAAESMDKYLMFNRIIQCRYIPPEERSRRVVPGKISTSDYPRKRNRIKTLMNNKKAMDNLDQKTYLRKVQKKVKEFKRNFERIGVDFTFNIQNEELKEVKIEQTSKDPEVKTEDGAENQFGVLEIDESDNDISFKTPPKVKKVIKKSMNSPTKKLPKKSETKKEKKMNQLKNKGPKQIIKKEKLIKKKEKNLNNATLKSDKKVKSKLKSAEPLMTKESYKTNIKAVINEKNLKAKRSVGHGQSKKRCLKETESSKVRKAFKKIKAITKN